jgi:two-component system OmpR family sensor kinase
VRPVSLSGRLVLTLSASLAAVWLVAVVGGTAVFWLELGEALDGNLRESAKRLAFFTEYDVNRQGRGIGAEAAPAGQTGPTLLGADDDYLSYQLRDRLGRVVLRSGDAPEAPFGVPLEVGFADGGGNRYYTEATADGRYFLQVAEPHAHRAEAMLEGALWLAAPLALLLPIAGLSILVITGRALRPLADLRAEIGARGSRDLSPIDNGQMPLELGAIAQDVNRLLDRLQRALENERAFTANAAHELRTPIAAALAQAQRLHTQLGEGLLRARAEQVIDRIGALANLVDKLLQLSRIEASGVLRPEPAELASVIRLVAEDCARQHRADGRVRVNLTDGRAPCARVDIDAFSIALRNLIENALVHGAPAGTVDVTVDARGAVHVANGGRLVTPDKLQALTRRFERGDATAGGSGLGLAISDMAARQCGGRLELISPRPGSADGFEAVLHLAPADSAVAATVALAEVPPSR